jgi:hypothetical protein
MYAEQATREGEKKERERVISWLRWLNTANKNPAAKAVLDRIFNSGGATIPCLADALERGEHKTPRDE